MTPLAAAITSIDFDHQAQLGDTIEAIALEKAGVIKAGIPVVCGDLPQEAERVIAGVCADRGARLIRAAACAGRADVERARIALPGAHQRANALVAACLLREIDALGVAVGPAAIRTGLEEVDWPGRLELVRSGGTDVLLDAAHNPAGSRALARFVGETGWTGCALVFGAMQDKDVPAMLAALAPEFRAIVCTTAPTPRAMPAEALAAAARAVPGAAWSVSAVAEPVEALAAAARVDARVVAAGSIFLIGPLRGILRPR